MLDEQKNPNVLNAEADASKLHTSMQTQLLRELVFRLRVQMSYSRRDVAKAAERANKFGQWLSEAEFADAIVAVLDEADAERTRRKDAAKQAKSAQNVQATTQTPASGQDSSGSNNSNSSDDNSQRLPMNLFTDSELAYQFVAKMGDVLKQVNGTKGRKWRLWTNKRWKRVETREEFASLVRTFLQQKATDCDKYKNGAQIRALLERHSKLMAVAGEVEIRTELLASAEAWDAKRFLIGTPSGIVDLRTGQSRAAQKTDMVSRSTTVDPAEGEGEEIKPTRFLQFLNEIFGDEAALIEYIQTLLGYFLTGETSEQIIHIWIGRGRNGKNTLIELVQDLLGEYGVKIGIEALLGTETSNSYALASICQLDGTRLAISNEPPAGKFWRTELINTLTGDKRIPCKALYENPREFENRAKAVVLANNAPRLDKVNEAERWRFKLVRFERVFSAQEVDPDLPRKLRQELPQIFRWIIEGAKKWYACGLPRLAQVEEHSQEYVASQDLIEVFVQRHWDFAPKGQTKAQVIYESWKKFCSTEGTSARVSRMSQTELMDALVERYGKKFGVTHRNRHKAGGGEILGIIETKVQPEPMSTMEDWGFEENDSNDPIAQFAPEELRDAQYWDE